MKQQAQPVEVIYSHVDGAHFFTVSEGCYAGVCSASTDLKIAYEDVAVQLEELAADNNGNGIRFVPAVSFLEFRADLEKILSAEVSMKKLKPQVPSQWTPNKTPGNGQKAA